MFFASLQNLTQLLNKLRDIVSSQTEAEAVEACGRTLEVLCSAQHAVYTRCNVARATITDMCVNRYKEAIDEFRSLIEGVSGGRGRPARVRRGADVHSVARARRRTQTRSST